MSMMTRRGFLVAAAGAVCAATLGGCAASPQEGHPSASNGGEASETSAASMQPSIGTEGASMLFINPSQNPDGNTARMGARLLEGIDHETVNLIDYRIYPLGASFPDDQFEEVWAKMCAADVIVWGTPIYWHSMSGALKVLIDRMYDYQDGELEGKKLAFFQQGGAPTQQSLEMNDYIIGRVATLYGMELLGTSDSADEIPALREAILASA